VRCKKKWFGTRQIGVSPFAETGVTDKGVWKNAQWRGKVNKNCTNTTNREEKTEQKNGSPNRGGYPKEGNSLTRGGGSSTQGRKGANKDWELNAGEFLKEVKKHVLFPERSAG